MIHRRTADLRQTPERVAKLWTEEFLAGYAMDPAKILGEPVVGEADPDVVVVSGLRFHSMCPHHLVPFRGVAHLAYMPAGKLAGFGRLADLVECFTKRLTLQERATHAHRRGALARPRPRAAPAACSRPSSFAWPCPASATTNRMVVTSAFVGEMAERPDLKARLLAACRGPGREWPAWVTLDGTDGGGDRHFARYRPRHRRIASRRPARPWQAALAAVAQAAFSTI